MKRRVQSKIALPDPEVRRVCCYGTCNEDFAYHIDGHDYCFAHGQFAIAHMKSDSQGFVKFPEPAQLELDRWTGDK